MSKLIDSPKYCPACVGGVCGRNGILPCDSDEEFPPDCPLEDGVTLPQNVIINDVITERARQKKLYGDKYHSFAEWHVILSEEVGEVARAILLGNYKSMRKGLIHMMAVASAIIEWYDPILDEMERHNEQNKPEVGE